MLQVIPSQTHLEAKSPTVTIQYRSDSNINNHDQFVFSKELWPSYTVSGFSLVDKKRLSFLSSIFLLLNNTVQSATGKHWLSDESFNLNKNAKIQKVFIRLCYAQLSDEHILPTTNRPMRLGWSKLITSLIYINIYAVFLHQHSAFKQIFGWQFN